MIITYERLALSRNKDEVMRLAREGQTIEKLSVCRARAGSTEGQDSK